ncbi:hypothetical protein TNCV_2960801 [Trichonephila clavipes]|nr:hypothetical protein TNCV_2960801 [Trichonephila clavipes]
MRKICSKMVPKNLSQVNRFLAKSSQGTSSWDTGKHSNSFNRPAEGYSNTRVPPVLLGVEETSSALCGFRRQLL